MEFEPILEVESPLEGQQACEELRSHGIKCSFDKILPPPDLTIGLWRPRLPRLYVMVAPNDADRASAILQAAWEATQRS